MKTFLFQFVNSYIALFYIAFIKAGQINLLGIEGGEYCHDLYRFDVKVDALLEEGGGVNKYCMDELGSYLSYIFTFSLALNVFLEYIFPKASHWYAVWSEESKLRKIFGSGAVPKMTQYEEERKLEPHEGCFSEYNNLIITLGYVVLFAPAFPLAAMICYGACLLEMRTDTFKLLSNTQRPRYVGAQDIGSWQRVLWLISVIGVLTNMALIGFTSTYFHSLLPFHILGFEVTTTNKTVFLFVCEHLILLGQVIVSDVLPDTPVDTSIQRSIVKWRAKAALAAKEGRPPKAKTVWEAAKMSGSLFGDHDLGQPKA